LNNTCISEQHCRNTDGFYECFCPNGQSGNGTKAGGCHRRDVITKIAIGKPLTISQIYFQFKLLVCVIYVLSLVLVKIESFENTQVR